MTRRSDLEAVRARGGRLTAEQAELLDEHERFDAFFCSFCGCYFASATDTPDVQREKAAAHDCPI